MRKTFLILALMVPVCSFGARQVQPDGYMLYVFWSLALAVVLGLLGAAFAPKLTGMKKPKRKRPEVHLIANKGDQPEVLTLFLVNQSGKTVDFDAPVLEFCKGLKRRKFKLKGARGAEQYPLRLENGREYELQIKLAVFHQHDPALGLFRKARVVLADSSGQNYTSKYIRFRKN
ncbi:hypothetical protein [Mangrovibacterium marinum]|uniref:Uncharacterized protein n=1 Tax=Mangrovibacterium marinum TaxID=1639118 RepID=A0A2T5BYL6_9BACT|nr:hypothetical protein [Mangrovibacterium marinum]PTN07331.1 hypothetical protein C8N47_11944 [Mangrovibacterium marinum]